MIRAAYFWSPYQSDSEDLWADTRGDELIHGHYYWRFDETFIPDDLDAINDYVQSEFEDAGYNGGYLNAVNELLEIDGHWQFIQYDDNQQMAVPSSWFTHVKNMIKDKFGRDAALVELMIGAANRIDYTRSRKG